jgi:hypothetical protein
MSIEKQVFKTDVLAVDIPTMHKMTPQQYDKYLRGGLFTVDHHDILRSEPAGYPLATTKKQMKALIAYLQEITHEVGGDESE